MHRDSITLGRPGFQSWSIGKYINRGPSLWLQGLLLAKREEEERRFASAPSEDLPGLVSCALFESLFRYP